MTTKAKVKSQNSKVTERPILFSAPMVRAILDGRKTQTRRVVKVKPDAELHFGAGRFYFLEDEKKYIHCPFGVPGDRLWVRENWHPDPPVNGKWDYYGFTDGELYNFDQLPKKYKNPKHVIYQASWDGSPLKWCPSIHMFRWASRITLEVTAVRVERLQEISEEDAKAEGFSREVCASAFRNAFGKFKDADVGYRRWLTDAKRGSNDGDFCEECVEAAAKKHDAEIDGWDDCFEVDHPITCDACGKLLHHSLTKYGCDEELMIGAGYEHAPKHFPVHGADAWILHNLADGIGDYHEEEHAGRLAQFGFGTLWNSLNAARGFGWDVNPWVWVVEFKRVEGGAR